MSFLRLFGLGWLVGKIEVVASDRGRKADSKGFGRGSLIAYSCVWRQVFMRHYCATSYFLRFIALLL